MNPRQRRGVAVTALSAVGAAGVFVAVSGYTATVARQLGPTRPVLVLAHDVQPYWTIRPDDVEVSAVPAVFTTRTDLSDVDQIAGRVVTTSLRQGSRLQDDMLVAAPEALPGEREVTVNVGVEASVAAALRPGDRVDVIAAYEAAGKTPPHAEVAVSEVRVLRVTRLRSPASGAEETGVLAGDTVLAVTVALAPPAASKVVLAQTVARTLRLALVPPTGRSR
jgi:Flp pilus assembly protein CpaB